MRLRRLVVALLPIVFAGCLEGSETITYTVPSVEQTTFASALNVDLTQSIKTGSGLYYRDLVVGGGNAALTTSTAQVYYVGYTPNGQKIDELASPSAPFVVTISNANSAIAGFREGIVGMKVGGKRQVIIPAELAYGNSVLVFTIDLVSVQ